MTMKKHAYLGEIETFYHDRIALRPDAERSTRLLSPDYAADTFARLPEGMAQTAFGCGNPVAFAQVREGETVLDLGCGAGLDLLIAAERVGPAGRVIGVDMSGELARRARRNAAQAGADNVEVRIGEIEALPVEDASVDWVISNCVINLSMDKPAVFGGIARVLRPGGGLLISDLVAEDLPEWVTEHRDLHAACISGAVSENAYAGHAEKAGLTDLKVVDRMKYGAAEIRVLVEDELPVALETLAGRMGKTRDEMLDFAARELSGRIASIKLSGRRPAV